MARINKKKKELPGISTSSLPDIIFILLFFFMVVTVFKKGDPMVEIKLPQANELTKLENKEAVSYILIGKPIDKYRAKLGDAPRIQLNDQFAPVEDIGPFVEKARSSTPDKFKNAMTMALRVDIKVKMGIVSDVKQELRKADALKINYSALPAGEE